MKAIYSKISRRKVILLIIISLATILSGFYVITLGAVDIQVKEVYTIIVSSIFGEAENTSVSEGVIMQIRAPRIILALVAGIGLGSAGAIMQSLLRNPLASPYTLGISSGAAFGASLTIILGNTLLGTRFAVLSSHMVILGALTFGILTVLVINSIASLKGTEASTLILAGVAVGYMFSAGTTFMRYIADNEELREITIWMMGGLYRANWMDIAILLPVTIAGFLMFLRYAWDLNTLNAGDEVALNLGVDALKLRKTGTMLASGLVSFIIAYTGIIGFVGLIAPHVSRMIIGNDNRFLLIASGLSGGLLLLWADTLSRILIQPTELPVGVVTSALGAPFFLYMLLRKRRDYWS